MKSASPSRQLAGFLARYSPAIRRQARAALATMRARLPGATEFVYDNYNALVIGFGPTDRPSDAVFSIVLYPRWVTLFFLNSAELADPQKLLKGSGRIVRHIVLDEASTLDKPAVRALMADALADADPPFTSNRHRQLTIRSISPRRRSRRPSSR